MNPTQQIQRCQGSWHDLQGNYLSYNYWVAEAECRLSRGERSSRCKVCERYQWTDQQCELFEEDTDVSAG